MSEQNTNKGKPDWEKIEQRYREGMLSIREIARLDGNVSDTAIRKRANAECWTRDLNDKIQKKADDIVRRAEVRTKVRTANQPTERVLIETSAEIIAGVKQGHRKDIARFRDLVNGLLNKLETIDTMTLPAKIDGVRKLSDALRGLIDKEREAYNMDADDKKHRSTTEDALTTLLQEIQGSTFPVVDVPDALAHHDD